LAEGKEKSLCVCVFVAGCPACPDLPSSKPRPPRSPSSKPRLPRSRSSRHQAAQTASPVAARRAHLLSSPRARVSRPRARSSPAPCAASRRLPRASALVSSACPRPCACAQPAVRARARAALPPPAARQRPVCGPCRPSAPFCARQRPAAAPPCCLPVRVSVVPCECPEPSLLVLLYFFRAMIVISIVFVRFSLASSGSIAA